MKWDTIYLKRIKQVREPNLVLLALEIFSKQDALGTIQTNEDPSPRRTKVKTSFFVILLFHQQTWSTYADLKIDIFMMASDYRMVKSKHEFPASSSRRSSTRKSSGTICMLTFFFLIASAIYVITNYSKLLNESLLSKSNNENIEAQKRKDEKIVIHPSENEQKLKFKSRNLFSQVRRKRKKTMVLNVRNLQELVFSWKMLQLV